MAYSPFKEAILAEVSKNVFVNTNGPYVKETMTIGAKKNELRLGQLVFKTSSILECWNGDFNGQPQPTGAYVYFLSANTTLCGQITNKGTVVLVR